MVNKVLYIEGTRDDTNGDLREGFRILLEQKLKGKMPRIFMCNGKSETIEYYRNPKVNARYQHVSALIDSDTHETADQRQTREAASPSVYLMVQEMETWFLSQPSILDDSFKINISDKITTSDITTINDPSDKLVTWTRQCKIPYHKVHHGVKLLKQLNLAELENKFPDVKRLIETLSK